MTYPRALLWSLELQIDISLNELKQRYANLSDDELLLIYVSSDLTDIAKEAIENEINNRGLAEKEIEEAKRINLNLIKEREKTKYHYTKKPIKRLIRIKIIIIIIVAIGFILEMLGI